MEFHRPKKLWKIFDKRLALVFLFDYNVTRACRLIPFELDVGSLW
jgi:hypothetical protein